MPHHLLPSPTAVSWFLPRRRRVVTHSSAPRVLGHHGSHPHIASHDQTGWTRCNMVIMWKVQEQTYDQNIPKQSKTYEIHPNNYQIETSINFVKLSQCNFFPRCIDTDHSGTAVASCGIPFLFDLNFIYLVVCNSIEKIFIKFAKSSLNHLWKLSIYLFDSKSTTRSHCFSWGKKTIGANEPSFCSSFWCAMQSRNQHLHLETRPNRWPQGFMDSLNYLLINCYTNYKYVYMLVMSAYIIKTRLTNKHH